MRNSKDVCLYSAWSRTSIVFTSNLGVIRCELGIESTLTWFVRAMQPNGCVNTHHLGDFLMRVYYYSSAAGENVNILIVSQFRVEIT